MRKFRRIIVLVLALCLTVGLWGCEKDSGGARPPLYTDLTPQKNPYSFSAMPSEMLTLSEEGAAAVLAAVENIRPEYTWSHLYQLEEVEKRLEFDAAVEKHQFSALNGSGVLENAHLAALVKANNEAFLATKPFGFTEVEDDYIAQLCDFIVITVDRVKAIYPELDWPRVYCNLGNLKILYDVGMLSYAQVTSEKILAISKNNTQIVLTMKGEDGFSQVLTHEIMHILQIGCDCEELGACSRRAGIALYWDDFPLNTTDWTWMVEGSAERVMCRLTTGKAVSYQYKMDYLCSMTMSVLLRDSVKADTMETLCFQDDPERLFKAFGAETDAQRRELLQMMITLQVLQMQPNGFMLAYREETGVDLNTDEDAFNQFCYSLKPAICTGLAKEFYENLTAFLRENSVSCNDLFFLMNLFEGHLNPHLTYTNESKAEINKPFVENYNILRKALFDALGQDNPDLDIAGLYAQYTITGTDKLILNADLSVLPEEKLAFLAERALWQAEQNGLGQKVPQA